MKGVWDLYRAIGTQSRLKWEGFVHTMLIRFERMLAGCLLPIRFAFHTMHSWHSNFVFHAKCNDNLLVL
jgi:hypothetical protein